MYRQFVYQFSYQFSSISTYLLQCYMFCHESAVYDKSNCLLRQKVIDYIDRILVKFLLTLPGVIHFSL